jgi:hypothetical protein
MRDNLIEAKKCAAINCFCAAAIMARRAVQSAAKQLSAVGGDLRAQIDDLKTKGKITMELAEWAHAVRWIGNDGAHPNATEVTKGDAEDAVELAEQLLHHVYVTPAIAAAQKAKRGKK